MIRWNRLAVACAASLLVAACSDSGHLPTAPQPELRRSGGFVVGGNDVPPDSMTLTQTTSDDPVLEEPGGNERGGGFVVGGN